MPELGVAARAELLRRADPSKAGAMRAYMKSKMPFLGVQAAGVRVDSVAIHRVGPLLPGIREQVLAWSNDPSLWKRRASIICQNARKAETDVSLLHACIEPNLGDREFFIRKAIGWALRERAKVAPEEVREFVSAHELSALSRREALKHL